MGNEVLILIAEAIALYFLVLVAHSLRDQFGSALFFTFVGGLTAMMSWVTDAGLTVSVGEVTFVVGSTVFYTSLLLSVFVVYVFDGPQKARIAISTVLFVSILAPAVAATLHLQRGYMGIAEVARLPLPDFRINAASATATLIDLIFLAIAWEYLGKPGFAKLWLRTYATLIGVMWLDVVLFTTGAFASTPGYWNIMQGTLISRFLISLLAFPFLYFYLHWQNRKNGLVIENRPVLAILKRVEEAESELSNFRKEMERRKKAEESLKKSEAILEATGRMAKVGGWELDAETREVSWTRETYRIHELPYGEKIDLETALGFFAPVEREKLSRAIDEALSVGEPYDLELDFETATGRRLWVRTICRPEVSDAKVVKLAGTFQDISERKELEMSLEKYRERLEARVAKRTRQLREAKKEWEDTFDSISDWIAIIDQNYRIVRSNNAIMDLFGLSPVQAIGKRCHEIVHQTPIPVSECPVAKAISGNLSESMEYQAEDGRWFEVLVDPLKQSEKESLFVHSVRDITELKNKEKEVLAARKAEAFSILSGGIAHDYNNLLSIIWGNISLLREDLEVPKSRKFFDAAETACEQARTLTHKFITLSQGAVLKKSPNRIEDLLHAVVKKTIQADNIDIQIILPEKLPPIEVDADLLAVAIQNVLANASEAMPSGGKLEIRAEKAIAGLEGSSVGQYLFLIFKDTGCGIPETDLPKVFDPYFTTKEMGSRRGMGLGLAVTRSILLKHGGRIKMESVAGQGSTATLTIPFRRRLCLPSRRNTMTIYRNVYLIPTSRENTRRSPF
jgi:PAS domain S-box-containing protein